MPSWLLAGTLSAATLPFTALNHHLAGVSKVPGVVFYKALKCLKVRTRSYPSPRNVPILRAQSTEYHQQPQSSSSSVPPSITDSPEPTSPTDLKPSCNEVIMQGYHHLAALARRGDNEIIRKRGRTRPKGGCVICHAVTLSFSAAGAISGNLHILHPRLACHSRCPHDPIPTSNGFVESSNIISPPKLQSASLTFLSCPSASLPPCSHSPPPPTPRRVYLSTLTKCACVRAS